EQSHGFRFCSAIYDGAGVTEYVGKGIREELINMTSDRTGRIAKNTLLLYVRMLLAMVIGFYTSRIILTELGVSDFGIYEVVGGLVGMFGVLNISMANTTSRFITVAIGKNDLADLRQVFSTALTIHLLLGILFVL